jgi:hypothetical protein
MVPWAFRRRPLALRRLRAAAVAFALTGVTIRVFAEFAPWSREPPSGTIAVVSAPFTLLCGFVWAVLLDDGGTHRTVLRRWLASGPLAMANAALTLGTLFALCKLDGPPFFPGFGLLTFLVGAALGATFGVIVWGPALILTLLFLGVPIGVASSMAKRGLAGEDRGDAIVGFACAGLGLFTLLPMGHAQSALRAEVWTQRATGAIACLLAGAVVAAASLRGARRRALLRDVESGRRSEYRIATTPDGRHLTRVQAAGADYRAADLEEPICKLDEAVLTRKA